MTVKGLFISVEGPDGAGKTSVIQELTEKLTKVATSPIVVTREPGGSPLAEKIRHVILDKQNVEMDERTEALLYAASRRQHLVETILPSLEEGKIVICDRFVDSSLAYQGAGRKIGMTEIANMNLFATEGLEPDFTLYLDVDSDTGLRRIYKNRQEDLDRLDAETPEFHQRVRHGYLQILKENPTRIHKVDAKQALGDVVSQSYELICQANPQYFKKA